MKHKSYTLILLLLSTHLLHAETEKSATFDLNKDKIVDRIEYSVGKKIVRIEEDRNGDGKIDFKTVLDNSEFYRIESQDEDYDGKFERKKSFKKLVGTKSAAITEIDQDADGIFEVKYQTIQDRDQKQDACLDYVDEKIDDLTNNSLKSVAKAQNGLLPTGLGYKVDTECYNKWGHDFNQIIKDVALGGLQCLRDLDKQARKPGSQTGALRNAFEMSKLMENDKISLVCSEKDYNWVGSQAHASTESSGKIAEKNVSHPFVSLNPNYPENPIENRAAEIENLKDTIFHETLHNLGYLHDESIEFPYTCGLCCFDKNANKELKDQACKVCTGNYKNETDIAYIKDFLQFSKLNSQDKRGAAAVAKFMKENKKSASGISMLAFAQAGVFNPVGPELGKLVEAQNLKLSSEDSSYLKESQKYKTSAEFQLLKGTSPVLAKSLYEIYYNQDGEKAVALLEQNREVIKKELDSMKKMSGDYQYVHDDTKNVLDKIIFELWINKYPDSANSEKISNRAYELNTYFE